MSTIAVFVSSSSGSTPQVHHHAKSLDANSMNPLASNAIPCPMRVALEPQHAAVRGEHVVDRLR
eukprot:scaffold19367_cov33-Tisochrysis_lutea.AAC.1